MALVGLNVTSVTPIVNVDGGGGAVSTGTSAVAVAVAVEAAALGGGDATTTTVYLFNSNNGFKKSTRCCDAFFSTMAHLTPFNSSNS